LLADGGKCQGLARSKEVVDRRLDEFADREGIRLGLFF